MGNIPLKDQRHSRAVDVLPVKNAQFSPEQSADTSRFIDYKMKKLERFVRIQAASNYR